MTFSYAAVTGLVGNYLNLKSLLYYNPLTIVAWVALFFLIVFLITTSEPNLEGVVNFLSTMAVFLVATPLISLAIYIYQTKNIPVFSFSKKPSPQVAGVEFLANSPDIYYIVLDRYGSESVLKKVYDFDNSEFTSYLESSGFFIASQSTANYVKTVHSLASTLNLEYINYLSEEIGEESFDLIPLYSKLYDNRVVQYLKPKGYKYLHFGSWWNATSRNKLADENYNVYFVPEFTRILFQTTYLNPLSTYIGIYDVRKEHSERILFKFDKLSQVSSIEGPTFTFAHFIVTHPPYMFDKEGNLLSVEEINSNSTKENYLNHLMFLNSKLTKLIDHLLDSDNPPIIILQSDEGPYPKRLEENEDTFDWRSATNKELYEKMGILNAIYSPGVDNSDLYSSITPVNTFRYVFNKYFDTSYELLEDRNYVFPNSDLPYKFSDVTEVVSESINEN
jgi:hypothetical protein